MKFDFWDYLMLEAFMERARRKKAQEAANPGKKKPRILPIILGMFACGLLGMIATVGDIKSLDVILTFVNILLWVLLIRAIIKRVKK